MYFTFEKCYRKGAIQKHVRKSPEQHNQIRHGQRKVFYYGVRVVGLLQLPQWNISHSPYRDVRVRMNSTLRNC